MTPENVISEEPGTRKPRNSAPRVAIVAAGAGARGAFEAGALSVLVPWLAKQRLRPTVFVGTSAGSINAALLAGTAELEPDDAAEKLLAFWRSVTVRSVYRSPLLSGPGTVAAYVGQLLGQPRRQPPRHDTDDGVRRANARPLRRSAAQQRRERASAGTRGRRHGRQRANDRVCRPRPGRTPAGHQPGAGDRLPGDRGDVEAVLASSAIPVLFRPVEIDGGYYVDGGVRLNAPLAPAVALGATHIVAVATHPETYPAAPPEQPQQRPPDVVDSTVSMLSSPLADRMIEDIHTLDKLNANVNGGPARLIPRLFVGPKTRHEIGELAAKVYGERYTAAASSTSSTSGCFTLSLGREKGNGDLLSYVFFDKTFLEAAIQLGIRYARNKTGGTAPWQPSPAVAQTGPTST